MVLPVDTCRLCAASGNRCISVFGTEGEKNHLLHKLRICSPVTVKETDELPTVVCLNCLSSLDQTYDFYQQIKEAQCKLLSMVESDVEMGEQKRRPPADCDYSQDTKRQCLGSSTESKGTTPPLYVVINKSEEKVEDTSTQKEQSRDGGKKLDAEGRKIVPVNPVSPLRAEKNISPVDPVSNQLLNLPAESSSALQGPDTQVPPMESRDVDSTLPQDTSECDTPVSDGTGLNACDAVVFKKCRFCPREFPVDTLAEHEAIHPKGRKTISCHQCNRSFFFEEAYKRHMAKHNRHNVSS